MQHPLAPTPFSRIKIMVEDFIDLLQNADKKFTLNLHDKPMGFFLEYEDLERILKNFKTMEPNGKCLFLFGLEKNLDKSNFTLCGLASDMEGKISKEYINNSSANGEEKWKLKTNSTLKVNKTDLKKVFDRTNPC